MPKTADEINEITQKIIGCAIEVHRTLGPGLLESVYRECLAFELHRCGLHFEENCKLPISYKGHLLKTTLVLDLLVEQSVVVELKAVESLHPIHSAQVLTYLRLSGCPAGLLLNFNTTSIRTGLRRLTHPDLYTKKRSD